MQLANVSENDLLERQETDEGVVLGKVECPRSGNKYDRPERKKIPKGSLSWELTNMNAKRVNMDCAWGIEPKQRILEPNFGGSGTQ